MTELEREDSKRPDQPFGWCIVGAAMFLKIVTGAHFHVMAVFLVEFEDHFQQSLQMLSIMASVRVSLIDISGEAPRQMRCTSVSKYDTLV